MITRLSVFGKEYPIRSHISGNWYLVDHPEGPAIATTEFNFLSTLDRAHNDLPEDVRVEAISIYIEFARVEIKRLRAIFPKICEAIGNGSVCSADSSIEFLEQIPKEVQLACS